MPGATHDFAQSRTSGATRYGTTRCCAAPAPTRTPESLPPAHRPDGDPVTVHDGLDCLPPPAERAGHLCLARCHAQRAHPIIAGRLAGDGDRLCDPAGLRVVGQPLCGRETASTQPGTGRLQRLCHRQRHRPVDALWRLGSLSPVRTARAWCWRSRTHDRVCQPVTWLRAAAPGRLGDIEQPAGGLDSAGVGARPAGSCCQRRAGGVCLTGNWLVPPTPGRATGGQ